jgi:hypothetical protein
MMEVLDKIYAWFYNDMSPSYAFIPYVLQFMF